MKLIGVIALIIAYFYAVAIWYNIFLSGGYYKIAPWYQSAFGLLVLLAGIIFCTKLIRRILGGGIFLLLFGIITATIQGCTYVKSNQMVLYSEDCGVNWQQVPAGNRVPSGAGNPCFVKETMPGYEMQGDMEYYVLFKDQVKVKIRLTYSYLIENPILFMKSAKKLGRANADADDAQEDNERFEGAENRVIETRIKKVTSDEFPKEDVVTHDMNALELTYMDLVNKELSTRGVRVTTFEMVPDFQPLTQQAIDATNAERIYAAKNMQDLGHQITIARAGATQIIVNEKGEK